MVKATHTGNQRSPTKDPMGWTSTATQFRPFIAGVGKIKAWVTE